MRPYRSFCCIPVTIPHVSHPGLVWRGQISFLHTHVVCTVIPILVALQVDTMEWPPYASMMLVELFDLAAKNYVRVTYNGQVLSLPFCGSQTLCDFETFSGYLGSVTPSNPAQQCQI